MKVGDTVLWWNKGDKSYIYTGTVLRCDRKTVLVLSNDRETHDAAVWRVPLDQTFVSPIVYVDPKRRRRAYITTDITATGHYVQDKDFGQE